MTNEQKTFIDTYAKVAFAKLYDRKNALVAADLLNDRVLPFFEEHEIPLLRVLTDRGTEFHGNDCLEILSFLSFTVNSRFPESPHDVHDALLDSHWHHAEEKHLALDPLPTEELS